MAHENWLKRPHRKPLRLCSSTLEESLQGGAEEDLQVAEPCTGHCASATHVLPTLQEFQFTSCPSPFLLLLRFQLQNHYKAVTAMEPRQWR